MNFPDNYFDRVVSLSTIEHIPDDTAAAVEMSRVLKPGGMLILTTTFAPEYRQDSDIPHHRGLDGKWTGDLGRVYSAEALFSRIIKPTRLDFVGTWDFSLDPENMRCYQIPGGSPDFASVAIFLTKR